MCMSGNVSDYYGDKENFHKFYALHESPELKWEDLQKEIPLLPRGWFELSKLETNDRIEFTYEYWMAKIPFGGERTTEYEHRLNSFFGKIDDIGIFASQSLPKSPFDIHMIYSLKGGEEFFHGAPPANLQAIRALTHKFAHFNLPSDYLQFFEIHDGFSKVTDTGLISTKNLPRVYQHLQQLLVQDMILTPEGLAINPSFLIPFYESFALHCYQCFYADWYPEEEMGNVFFSEIDLTMSNFSDPNRLEENLAFPTFISWLLFYLEDNLKI